MNQLSSTHHTPIPSPMAYHTPPPSAPQPPPHPQVRPPRGWLEATLAALRGRCAALGPQGTANLLWGLARLGCVPDRGWLAACFAATLPVLGASNGQELSLLAWALAQLRLEPSDEWLDEWFDASEARLPGFSLTVRYVCVRVRCDCQ